MIKCTINRAIINILTLAIIAAAFPACDDIYHTSQKQIKNGGFTSLVAMIFGGGLSPYQAQSLTFGDSAPGEYVFAGSLIIGAPINNANTIEYYVDYGPSPSTPYDSSGSTVYLSTSYLGTTTPISVGGDLSTSGDTYLRVYTMYYDTATARNVVVPRPTSLRISDMVMRRVTTINTSGFNPWNFVPFNDHLYFFGTDGINTDTLWRWNGSHIPAVDFYEKIPVTDSYSGSSDLVVLGTGLYFSATDGTNGEELWYCDGTTAPYMIYNINTTTGTGSNPYDLTVYNNDLYFQATGDPDNSVLGAELAGAEFWMYDGTSSPELIADLFTSYYDFPANTIPNNSSPYGFTVYDNLLYFTAYTGSAHRLLFEYDGTYPYPMPATGSGPNFYYDPDNFIVYNGKLFFSAYSDNGKQLFVYDGVNMPIWVYGGMNSNFNPNNFAIYNGKLFFQGTVGGDTELYSYDDRYPGNPPSLAVDIYASGSSSPTNLKVFNNKLYFNASNGSGNYLWVYDDLSTIDYINNPRTISNTEPYNPYHLTVFNNSLCFQGSDATYNSQLWQYYEK